MSTAETFALDETGKIDITDIYNKPDPRRYYSTLRHLDYQIPEAAKPVFQRVISAYRQAHEKDKVRVVDVGCSYGVNAALLKCGTSAGEEPQSPDETGTERGARLRHHSVASTAPDPVPDRYRPDRR